MTPDLPNPVDFAIPAFVLLAAGGDDVPLVPYATFGTEALAQGVAGALAGAWLAPALLVQSAWALLAPAGTPKEIVEAMQAEMKKALTGDELKGIWTGLGTETPNLYGDAFGKFVSSEVKRWHEVVKASGAKLD